MIMNIIMSALHTATKRHLRISIKLEMSDICQTLWWPSTFCSDTTNVIHYGIKT